MIAMPGRLNPKNKREIPNEEWLFLDCPLGIMVFDAEGKYLRMNNACRDLLRTSETSKTHQYSIFKDTLLPEEILNQVKEGISVHAEIPLDFSRLSKNGWFETAYSGIRDFEILLYPIGRSATGKINGYVLRFLDVTNKKIDNEKIRQSEETLRSLIYSSPQALLLLSMDDQILAVNDKFAELLGLVGFSLNNSNLAEFFQSKKDASQFSLIEQVKITGKPVYSEIEVGGRSLETFIQPILDPERKITHLAIWSTDITQRKLMEHALRDSELRFHNLFDETPIAILEEDFSTVKRFLLGLQKKGIRDIPAYLSKNSEELKRCVNLVRITDINKAAIRLFNARSKKEVLMHFGHIVRDESYNAFLQQLENILEGKTFYEQEVINYNLSGKKLHLILHWAAVPGTEADLNRVIISLEDITERKLAEVALRGSEQKFRGVLEQSHDTILVTDEWGRITEWNNAQEQVTGLKKEEVVNRYLWDIYSQISSSQENEPQHTKKLQRSINKLLRQSRAPESVQNELREIHHKDGGFRVMEIATFPIKTEIGHMLCSVGRDVTERKMAEDALRASEERFRALATNATDVVCLHNPEGIILYASPSSQKLLGYAPGELIGKDPLHFMHPDDAKSMQEDFYYRAFHGQPVSSVDIRLKNKNNVYIWFETNAQAVLDQDHKIIQFVTISRDVTARKMAEMELKETRANLQEKVKELQHRTTEINCLTDMVNMLQKCTQTSETYAVISQYARELFPTTSGLVMMLDELSEKYQVVMSWGDLVLPNSEFQKKDCWALRLNKLYSTSYEVKRPVCNHVGSSIPTSTICVPIEVEDKVIGILHLQTSPGTFPLKEAEFQLAVATSEQINLAMTNIKLSESLREQAIRDPLTGLYNRYYMEESLERELKRSERSNKPVSVIMLDFDNFKELNTLYGHPNVDEMLREFGKLLRNSIRGGDIACRYGGDEFLVILPEASLKVTSQRAEELRQRVKNLVVHKEGLEPRIATISVGIASWPNHGESVPLLLRSVDAALLIAKEQHDCVVIAE
jgi:diguanylate cyclase (GGDEF)-like protein/PAS domain S-box-containing protein